MCSLHVNRSTPCTPQSLNTEHPTKCFSSNQFQKLYTFIPLISLNYSMVYISIDVVKSIVKAIAKTIVKDVVRAIARPIIIDIYKPTIDRIDNPIVRNIFKNCQICFSSILKKNSQPSSKLLSKQLSKQNQSHCKIKL